MTIKFGMIGGGIMGEALLSRLVSKSIYQPSEILVSEPNQARRSFLAQHYGVGVTGDNRSAACATDVLLLAIKPQIFEIVLSDLADTLSSFPEEIAPVVVSILAGTPLSKLESGFPGWPVIRAMPNTPATVGSGISAITAGTCVQPHHLDFARQILQAVGDVVEVPESMMDAVTGLSGSGPAYVSILIEALTDGGVYAGLPRPIAAKLALQTVLGTATMLHETKMHPAELKDRVTSPGGTTIAGLAQLEKAGFRSALIEAVKAAARRSQELGS
ncbi:pyrroline-5-carboxylate reductase [Ancylothrix sp. C2]|uniref:pyrroline-5-carboxylate reductase n=1 Tax=Ancylothrix sp. D3o TaxID=2953691 RepID=UPI0021BB8F7A|nr:pyrroline-5-carboxylate reductase [Ancylothrix sp. D3o]MCT7949915.1 pyrroline-5-carboxylate reductase [Ancylothrix sp. D3o]